MRIYNGVTRGYRDSCDESCEVQFGVREGEKAHISWERQTEMVQLSPQQEEQYRHGYEEASAREDKIMKTKTIKKYQDHKKRLSENFFRKEWTRKISAKTERPINKILTQAKRRRKAVDLVKSQID